MRRDLKKKLPKDVEEKVRKLWDEGLPKIQIAKAIGYKNSTLSPYFRQFDPPLPERPGNRDTVRPTSDFAKKMKRLRELWANEESLESITKTLGYSEVASTLRAARRLELPARAIDLKGSHWTKKEVELLRQELKKGTLVAHVAALLGRTESSVQGQIVALGLGKRGGVGVSSLTLVRQRVLEVLEERGPLHSYQLRDLVFLPMRMPLRKVSSFLHRMRRKGLIEPDRNSPPTGVMARWRRCANVEQSDVQR